MTEGGACEAGPTTQGSCGCGEIPCIPFPSLRSRRGRAVRWAMATAISGLAMVLGSSWRNEFLAPGPLTKAHAQLLHRGAAPSNQGPAIPWRDRCQACHAPVAARLPKGDDASPHVSQTLLCLKCHAATLPETTATAAHGISPQLLRASTTRQQGSEGRGPGEPASSTTSTQNDIGSVPRDSLACAECHREHQGPDHDLKFMSNKACQTCHQQRFSSFANGHPEFSAWPSSRRTRIIFDHAAHAFRHFPDRQVTYSCHLCHAGKDGTPVRREPGFAVCATCHASAMEASLDAGIEMFRLPILDTEILADQGVDLEFWPAGARGDFDGILPPRMRKILAADETLAAILETLGEDFDFLDLDGENQEQAELAGKLARGIRDTIERLADQPESSAAPIPATVARAMRQAWFPEGDVKDMKQGEEASEPIFGADMAWQRNDALFTLRYRPQGHADRKYTELLDQVAREAGGAWERLPADLTDPTAPGLCRSCHSVDRVEREGVAQLEFQWRAAAETSGPRFTRFSHDPHLLLPELSDCSACHGLKRESNHDHGPGVPTLATYAQAEPGQFNPPFTEMSRAGCATCHTPTAAGDACVKCHYYHAFR